MSRRRASIVTYLMALSLAQGATAETLQSFSHDFWEWRAATQPYSDDDIPRIERPAGLSIAWSAAALQVREQRLQEFTRKWKLLAPPPNAAVAEQVDYRLLGSALARVRWESNVVQGWKRNPLFYIDQTLGSVYVLLLPPPPFSTARQRDIITRMSAIPATLAAARANLTDIRAPFARLAVAALADLPQRSQAMLAALTPQLDAAIARELKQSTDAAVASLSAYRAWLEEQLPSLKQETAIGRKAYISFLQEVALMPYSPEELLSVSTQEWSRTVAFEAYEQNRNLQAPALPLFASQQIQMAREYSDEEKVRAFLVKQRVLSLPAWLRHYRNLPLPAYVQPFADLGVTDDLTGPLRLNENGTSYIRKPDSDLGFFSLSTAHDPRPILVHEGIPGHYFQLCLSWKNADPIRRHYYDSGANEGIGFYAEEMMLQAGFFDDSPRTRETIYSFMRLRALRVEVDVKLALGLFTLDQAADYLTRTVPMDRATALDEAAMFASTPGQAISYQIGKAQIVALLADARRKQGKQFRLQTFHDFVWNNGNVPLSLQRWELLGDSSTVPPAPVQ